AARPSEPWLPLLPRAAILNAKVGPNYALRVGPNYALSTNWFVDAHGRARGGAGASPLQLQESERHHHQAGLVVEPTPRPALEMIQAEFTRHLEIPLFHWPSALPVGHPLANRGLHRQVRERVLERAVGLLLDQQPDWLGRDAIPGRPAVPRPDPGPTELCR